MGERRKRLTPELTRASIEDLDRLPLDVDKGATADVVFKATQTLCRKHALAAYDAAYLELAMRNGCPLATVDGDLERAARAEAVSVV